MMKTNLKKVWKALSMMLAVVLLVGTVGLQALAEEDESGTNGTGSSNTVTLYKYLTMDKNANVPNATFKFSIAQGTAIDATNSTPKVERGVIEAVKFIGANSDGTVNITFGPGDNTEEIASTNQKKAKKEIKVEIDVTKFSAPGIYRYVVTETDTNNQGVTNDGPKDRVLDVYIKSDDAGVLSFQSAVLHKGTEIKDGENETYGDNKSNSFTNEYKTADLTISKTVTGNQGFRSKYFQFTVNITGAVAGTIYTVDLSNAAASVNGNQNPSALTVGTNGSVTGNFYLKHGDSIVIQGLTENTQYVVSEDNEDYKASCQIGTAAAVDKNTTDTQTMGNTDVTVSFTNHREGTVPTGILVDVAPYILIFLLAGAGFVVLFGRKRRKA
ncbi:MAG: hypothetical protein IJ390_13230 [Lachnospiraceae bacterium]|nr:hypothetical protein [Lachnospiraceae bacterium]